MHCPVCKTVSLVNNTLEKNLQTMKCESCEGQWIKSFQYWKWLERHGALCLEKPEGEMAKLSVIESHEAKICPECAHLMTRRKVGHGIGFHIERCETCGGIWLDKNEWEILKSRNLHDEIHLMFGAVWQEQVRQDEFDDGIEQEFKDIFGKEDYAKLEEFKDWMDKHPKKSSILCFLNNL